jgi:hypothetical protein
MSDQEGVYVIVGYYSDKSSAKLLAVFESEEEAKDRVELITTSGAALQVRVISMPLNRGCPVEIFK